MSACYTWISRFIRLTKAILRKKCHEFQTIIKTIHKDAEIHRLQSSVVSPFAFIWQKQKGFCVFVSTEWTNKLNKYHIVLIKLISISLCVCAYQTTSYAEMTKFNEKQVDLSLSYGRIWDKPTQNIIIDPLVNPWTKNVQVYFFQWACRQANSLCGHPMSVLRILMYDMHTPCMWYFCAFIIEASTCTLLE